MVLSVAIALIYLSIGFNEKGYTVFFGLVEVENSFFKKGTVEAEWFYISLFTSFINRFWLGLGAILLGLISTVSVFPEFTREGAIEVSLSKPVTRFKLFAVKYLGCLLFVAVQASLFAVLAFIAIGIRLDYWNFTVFWVVPIITLAFSLIHCVQVLSGIITRSSVVALLTGLCFWGMVLLSQMGESMSYTVGYAMPENDLTISGNAISEEQDAESDDAVEFAKSAYSISKTINAPLPKIRDVTLYLDEFIKFRGSGSILDNIDLGKSVEAGQLEMKKLKVDRDTRTRNSKAYVFLTSIAFEFVVLGIALWIFLRRDY